MTAAAEIAAWLAASSQDRTSPKGDRIPVGPFGELASVGFYDVPPEAPAGCLALFTLAPGMCPHGPRQRGRNGLPAGRSTSLGWQGQDADFPAVAVLRFAAGATMRQACAAAGIAPTGPLWASPPKLSDLSQGQ